MHRSVTREQPRHHSLDRGITTKTLRVGFAGSSILLNPDDKSMAGSPRFGFAGAEHHKVINRFRSLRSNIDARHGVGTTWPAQAKQRDESEHDPGTECGHE